MTNPGVGVRRFMVEAKAFVLEIGRRKGCCEGLSRRNEILLVEGLDGP